MVDDHAPTIDDSSATHASPPKTLAHLDMLLVRRVQSGDKAAFRQLFDRYHHRAFVVALGVVKHAQDAQDVVQEAFLRVFRHIGHFAEQSSFTTWFHRILMNAAIDHLRRNRKTALRREPVEQVLAAPKHHGGAMVEASWQNPQRGAQQRQLAAALEAALQQLSTEHRSVVFLREVEGLSYEEIASALQIPKGTVMSRLFHARRRLQASLGSHLDEGAPIDLAPNAGVNKQVNE